MYSELERARSEMQTEGRLTYGTAVRLVELVAGHEGVVEHLLDRVRALTEKCDLLEIELARVTRPGAEEE